MSQKSKTFTVRVSQDRLALWKAETGNFNAWVVAALDAQFELDRAEARDRAASKEERVAEITKAFPQGVHTAAMLGASLGKKSYKPDPR